MNISKFKVSLESFADGDESSYVATDTNDSDKRHRTLRVTSNNDQSSIENELKGLAGQCRRAINSFLMLWALSK